MRCDRTFATLLPAAAVLVLSLGMSAASAQEQKQVGEICMQQNGVYMASFKTTFHQRGGGWRPDAKIGMLIGQTHCFPFMDTDDRVVVTIDVVAGDRKDCQVSLKGRTGRLMVTASGTTFNVGLACP